MSLNDAEAVRREYASEDGLATRASPYLYGTDGTDARDVVVAALERLSPACVLEVGCGWGKLAERNAREAGCRVAALDLSPRMVELALGRGIDARAGDVRELPFADVALDAVVAAWMLCRVADVDRALAEITRVLRPGGALVCVTNGVRDFEEVWSLVGRDTSARRSSFRAETGAAILDHHFASVERHDLVFPVVFPDGAALRAHVGSSVLGRAHLDRVPELREPLVATKVVAVFLAKTAA